LLVAAGAIRWGLGAAIRDLRHQARGTRSLLRGVGMIGGACGLVFEEYARDGRRLRFGRSA
jgi:hypothetical protein